MSDSITGSKRPLHDPSHVSQALREAARLLERLADDYERQVNAQNGQLNAALGNAELGLDNQIEELRGRVAAVEQEIRELRGADGARSG